MSSLEKFSKVRDKIQRILNSGNPENFEMIEAGNWKTVKQISPHHVIKTFTKQGFSAERTEAGLEEMRAKKRVVDQQISLAKFLLGDIFPKAKTFIGTKLNSAKEEVFCIFKVQEKVEIPQVFEFNWSINRMRELLSNQENLLLKKDLQTLLEAWKNLKKIGLSFDITHFKNNCFVNTPEGLRLKIFDVIPFLVIDRKLIPREIQINNLRIPGKELLVTENPPVGTVQKSEEIFRLLLSLEKENLI